MDNTNNAVIINYNGYNIAGLDGGQKATIKCAGKKLEGDVVVIVDTVEVSGTVTTVTQYCIQGTDDFVPSKLSDFVNSNNKITLENSVKNKNSFTTKELESPGGGNYGEVYPSINVSYADQVNDDAVIDFGMSTVKYFVPENWLAAITNIIDISNCFHNVGTLREDSTNKIKC